MRVERCLAALFLSAVVITVSVSVQAQSRPRLPLEPILTLEVGTHTGGINQIQPSHNRQNIFTVSDDQTLRIWDGVDGQLNRVIRGPAGPRDEGALYALAQSKQFIAIAGRVGWEWDKGTTTVRLLDAKDYRARGILSGLPAPISALSFSPDGKYLAVGLKGQGQGLRVYSLGTGKAAIKDINFPAGLVDLMFLDDGRLIALDGSGLLSFFNVQTLSKIQTLKIPKARSTWRMSQSPDGRFLAITHQDLPVLSVIDLYDSLNIKTFEGRGQKLGGIALAVWSNNGNLLHGVGDPQGIRKDDTVVLEQTLFTWDRRGQYLGRTKLSEMGITSPLTSLNLESQKKLLFGTSSGDWGRLNIDRSGNLTKDINVPTVIPNYRNLYKARLRTDASGSLISLPAPKNGLPAKIFNAEARELVRASSLSDRLDKTTQKTPDHTLSINVDDGLATYDGRIFPIRPKERALDVIAARKGQNIYLGTNFFVRAYLGRKEIWKMATSAPVWGVTPSGDDKVLIAYLGNGVIQWHDTQDGRLLRSLFVTRSSKHWVMWTPDGFFDHSATDKNGLSGAELVGFHINNGYKDEAVFVSINQLYQKYYRPDAVQAALQSQAGDDMIVAAALKDSTDTITTLRDSLPPKLVNFEVCGVNEFGDAAGCSTLKTTSTTRTLRAVLPQPVRDAKFIELILDVKNSGGGTGKIKVRRNGASIATEQIERIDQKNGYSTRERIEILPGENRLEIVALNAAQDVESSPISFTINSHQKQDNEQKTLHILAVGIADYNLDLLDLQENIAANDARDMAKIFATAAGPNGLYKNVESQVLVDAQATRPAILKALSSMADKVQSNDTVIIFLSGHGDVVDRDYTFATYEWGSASTDLIARVMKGRRFQDSAVREVYRREGLSQSLFMEKIERMSSKNVLIILDTCYAGSFTASSPSQRTAYSSTVAARMERESGRFVLASARGLANDSDGKDYPKGLGHGLFTSNAIDALTGLADHNNNNEVSLNEFGGYVKDKVIQASKDWEVPQVPVIQFQGDPYFPLVKVNQK